MDQALKNVCTSVYGNEGGRMPARFAQAIISWSAGLIRCAFAMFSECAASHGNFEISKEPELTSRETKVYIKNAVVPQRSV